MSILNSPKGKEIVQRVTLKNVKMGFGHDLQGLYADFSLNGKKMGYINDDGWGGEVEITYESKATQIDFERFLTQNNVAQIMFENGWEFMGDVKKITLHTQAEDVINSAVNLIEENKAIKKLEKKTLKGIVIVEMDAKGNIVAYRATTWKILLTALPLGAVQMTYNELKKRLKPNEKILNTNLEKLGVIL